MSSFTEQLHTVFIGGGFFRVTKAFRYYVGEEGSDDYVDVPEGFITDFASVPPVLDRIILKDGDYNQAAVVHDFLYYLHRILRDRNDPGFILEPFMKDYPLDQTKDRTRNEVDRILIEAMAVLDKLPEFHIPLWKRWLMYSGVRSFSWIPWNRKQKKFQKEVVAATV
jgi:hypothetical protein